MKYNPAKVTIEENKGRSGPFCQYVDEAPVHEIRLITAESRAQTRHQLENNVKSAYVSFTAASSSLTKSKPERQ